MSAPGGLPDFPGAIGLSQLAAYPWPTVDDEHGGSPHLHLACTECYVVVGGRGRLETLSHEGLKESDLRPADVVWFTPGTIHRAVNDGDLRVVVVMQNGGLPEAGDAVMTFPAEHLAPDRYPAAASVLDARGAPDPGRAKARRDLAVEGFLTLKRRWLAGDTTALDDFYEAAAALVRPRLDDWEKTVQDGAATAARTTLRQIEALRTGDWHHLREAEVARIAEPPGTSLGMCGFLRPYDPVRRTGASTAEH